MRKKEKTRFEALGDRMKELEMMEAGRRVMPGLPIMARLDGKNFHSFTRGMIRPYTPSMSQAMIETARYLVEKTQANFAYTQSDEISLGFWYDDPKTQPMFDGRIQKLTSVLAAMATAKFNQEVMERMPARWHRLPVFDARVFNLPSLDAMAECIVFRSLDCTKNSIMMAAQAQFTHKELQGKQAADMLNMLMDKGIDWRDYPSHFKDGTFLRREPMEHKITQERLDSIPEKYRPTAPVIRYRVQEVVTPPFDRLANQVGFLFYGEKPVKRVESLAEVI